MTSIWDQIRRVKVLVQSEDLNYLSGLLSGLKDLGMNVNEVELIVWSDDEKRKSIISSKIRSLVLSGKDLNFFGKVKDKDLKARINSGADLLLLIGELPQKLRKIVPLKTARYSCSLNQMSSFADMNLSTDKTSGEDQIEFLGKTLKKISVK